MSKFLKVLLAATVFTVSTATWAQAAHVRGVGAAPCKDLMQAHNQAGDELPEVERLTESWAYGYMARLNFERETAGQESADLTSLAPHKLYARILADCRAHPNDRVYEAVHRIYLSVLKVS